MTKKFLRVAVVWNGTVMQEELLREARPLVIGTSKTATLVLPVGETEDHVLFAPSGDTYTLSTMSGMVGRVSIGGSEKPVSELGGGATVSHEDWGVLTIGDVSIFFQWVDDESALIAGASPLSTIDWNVAASVLFSAFVHLFALLWATLLFDPTASAGEFDIDDRFVRILVSDLPDELLEDEDDDVDDTMAEAAAGEEGEFGEPDEEEDTELPDHDAPMIEELEVPELGQAFEAALAETGALSRIFDSSDNFMNNMGMDFATAGEGDAFELGRGALGLGRSGMGGGGGGDGFGRAGGVGNLDTGGGQGRGASLGRRDARAPRARMDRGRPNVAGFLSREQIERVVRRHSRGIRFCYERELQTDPSLAGRITANWTVGLDGRVTRQSVVENTMGNRNVESCILREVSRMRFDQPDGGLVEVSYPFTFRAGN